MRYIFLSLVLPLLLVSGALAQVNEMTLVGQYVGENDGDYFGTATAMGDFDDDGYTEFIIGAWAWNDNTGKNYYYDWDGDWPVDPAWTFQGAAPYYLYAAADQNIGDVNNDGIDDFGLYEYRTTTAYSRVDLFWGSTAFDSIPDFSIEPADSGWGLGLNLDSLGDVNGDGGNDFIMLNFPPSSSEPHIVIFYGGEILDDLPDWEYTPDPISGYGFCGGLGDINGDGFNDISLLGSEDPPLLFFGSADMDTIPDMVFSDYSYSENAAIGDVNDDGYCDFSLRLVPNHNTTGRAVYFGSADPDTIADGYLQDEFGDPTWAPYFVTHGDVNGDGISDLITGDVNWWGRACYIYLGSREFNTVPDEVILGVYSWFNWGEEISVGDVNNDGRDEILISSSDYWFDTGLVQLFTGSEEWIDYGAPVEPGDLPHTPGWFKLEQNYPNPFNATTVASFELRVASFISLAVYDIAGQEVTRLADGWRLAGKHKVTFHADDLPSGIYIVRLTAGEYTVARKMVLLR